MADIKTMTDEELLERNRAISDDEVLQDIRDTEAEISEMEGEADHYERTPLSAPTARLDRMRASVRRDGIAYRKEFIARLRNLLKMRGVDHE